MGNIAKKPKAIYTHSMSIYGFKRPSRENVSPEFVLLGFLIAGPSHAYDLHQHFKIEPGHVWHLSQRRAYATLKRLENPGNITAQMIGQQKLPARQMLHITEAGSQRFFEWPEL